MSHHTATALAGSAGPAVENTASGGPPAHGVSTGGTGPADPESAKPESNNPGSDNPGSDNTESNNRESDNREPDYTAEVAREVGALYLAVERRISRRPQPVGAPPLEKLAMHVLGRLEAEGPLRPSALAQLVQLDLSTVSRHVASLEAAGLLVREPDPDDRRACLVHTTEAGVEAMIALRARRRQHLDQVLAGWSLDDRRELVRLLGRFNADVAAVEGVLATPDPAVAGRDGTGA